MSDKINPVFAATWLDHNQAFIIHLVEGESKNEFQIGKIVKSTENRGGGGEHTMNNASKSERSKFLKEVSDNLTGFKEIYVFGPGTAQEHLLHAIEKDQRFNNVKVSIDSADRITENQMIAKARDYFRSRLV